MKNGAHQPPRAPPAEPAAGWSWRATGAITVVALTHTWSARDIHKNTAAIDIVFQQSGMASLSFDATGLQAWDTSLLVFLAELRSHARERGVDFDEAGLPEPARRLLALLSADVFLPAPAAPRAGLVRAVGATVIGICAESVAITGLVGETVLRGGAALAGHTRMRGTDLLDCMRNAGLGALPIVAVVNLLVGAILAFVGAVQLKQFGAVIYVANLVGVGMVREMAPLMTAIVMAGRTGGAYAARIATMQGNEEIDALQVFGIPVTDYAAALPWYEQFFGGKLGIDATRKLPTEGYRRDGGWPAECVLDAATHALVERRWDEYGIR